MAEAATGHPDGTFSMLKAGVDTYASDAPPFVIFGVAVARLSFTRAEAGEHVVRVRFLDGETDLLPAIEIHVDVPKEDIHVNFIHKVAQKIEKAGKFRLVLLVDGRELDSCVITTRQNEGVKA